MATRVNFGDDVYAQLQSPEESSDKSVELRFPEWDVLKEIDRRAKRAQRDDGKDIREWMRQHPKEVAQVRAKFFETLGG